MQEKVIKVIASILVIILLYSSLNVTISYAVNELLTENELENQNTSNDKNVDFDVFYEDEKHSKVISIFDDVQEENNKQEDNEKNNAIPANDTTIKVKINLKNIGYIDDGIIDFTDSNFVISNENDQKVIKEIKDNKLILNRLTGGEENIINLKITLRDNDKIANDFFNRDNSIKFIGTFVDEKGKESKVNNTIVLHTEWNVKNIEANIEQSITKYVPFNVEKQAGILLQSSINTGIKNAKAPIKTAHLEIEVPKIADILPKKVDIVAKSTASTNGDNEGITFSKDNWSYNDKTGMVTIDIENKANEEGKISWIKNVLDEFYAIYIYPENALNKVYEPGANINLKAKVSYKLYNNTDLEASKQDEKVFYVKDQIGSLVDVTSEINAKNINKGYLYTNKVASEENRNETEYEQKYTLNISDTSLVDEIILTLKNDIFASETDLYEEGSFINKTLKLNKSEIKNIFGESGNILLTIGESTININSDYPANEEGKIIIDLRESTGDVSFKTSKPVKVGTLEIAIAKAIAKNQSYTIEEMKTFKEIITNTVLSVKHNGSLMPVYKTEGKTVLEEPTSKITAEINKANLSTVVTNENVEIRAILETDSIDDVLYKNPKMAVIFPSYVTNVDITNCKSLHSDEIKITSTELTESKSGKAVIINFEGTQTIYNDDTTKGINVVLNTNIEVDRLTPSKNDYIEVAYINENESSRTSIQVPVKFVAPIGLVTVNELTNYEEGSGDITLINGKNENINQNGPIAAISTYTRSKIATVQGEIINNYNNSVSNMVVLGSIPNTDVEGNTFAAELQSAIRVDGENIKIYYSANANPTNDLSNAENGWVEGEVNYKAAKSFLVVLDNVLEKGKEIKFEYEINIPAGLSFNNTTKSSYTASYINNDISGVKQETKKSGDIVITTGEGPNLEVTLSTEDTINENLSQGQFVRFTATVKNIGTDATGVRMAIDETYGEVKKYNDGFDFEDEENVKEIGELKSGETRAINYILQVNENADVTENAEFKVGAVADRINTVITGAQNIKINKGTILLKNIISASRAASGVAELIKGENGSCGLYIKNISGEDLSNVTIRYKVGNEINIKEAGEVETFYSPFVNNGQVNISQDKHSVTYTLEKLAANEVKIFRLNTEVVNVGTDVSFKAAAEGKNENGEWSIHSNTQSANIKEYQVEINSLEIGVKNQERLEGEEVTYLYSVKNTGDLIVSLGKINCKLPNGLTFKEAQVASRINDNNIYNETINSIDNQEFIYEKTFLEIGEEIIIKVNALVDNFTEEEIENNTKEKELSMKATFTAMGIEKESDPEIYYAIYREDAHTAATYKISGKVWKDLNKNSKKDDEEEGIQDIQIALFERDSMKIATNENGENIVTKTLTDGSYDFNNLKNGKYLVAYLYNAEDYELSQYQMDGILKNQNSDATSKTAKYNGEDTIIALTDTIEIDNASQRNIDLGLIEKDKFNLNLVKEINKVTLNNDGKVKEMNYEDNSKQLVKVGINGEANTMVAEYKVTITNDGNIPGYANKIVSYLSDDMKFNSELNPDWYLGEDGNVYSTSLAREELMPGETKELTLVLTKNIENTEKDIINNKSEIAEEYNDQAIESVREYNAKEKQATASIEVVRTNNTVTILIITLVLLAIIATAGSILYMNREKTSLGKSIEKVLIRINEKINN